jgi:hypothetical protein
MGPQAIPDHQQGLPDLRVQRLKEFNNLFFLDAALVQPEQDEDARECCDDRDVAPPVEVKVDEGRLPLGRPGAHPRGALAQGRLVDKDDFPAFSLGFV